MEDKRSLYEVLFSDGRILLSFVGLMLIFSGIFVFVQSYIGEFLPHDTIYLGLNATELGKINPMIVNFMFHDRVSFGGTIISTGVIYIWLSEFPIRLKKDWAWWIYALSGIVGFGSFLSYLGHGYLDAYHGMASLLLLPVFILGLYLSYRSFPQKPVFKFSFLTKRRWKFRGIAEFGYKSLIFCALGIVLGGFVIMIVGMTFVFVPEDLDYMVMCSGDFSKINKNLTPLIAHDRASFGGGLSCVGILLLCIINNAKPSRNLWEVLLIAMSSGFLSVLAIHFMVGYTAFTHLLPAYLGTLAFYAGILCTYKVMYK